MRQILSIIVFLSVFTICSQAQIQRFAGPKIGVTLVQAGSLASILREDVGMFTDEVRNEWTGSTGKYGSFMTQYGWQWESRFSDGGNITGIVEWVALVGGMEKGMFLPSISSMVGLRSDKGVEITIGPNFSLGGLAMEIGMGYNFHLGKLNVPINILYVPSFNKTYYFDAEDRWVNVYDENGDLIDQYLENSPKYTVTHPTGARVSIMVGFNVSK